MALKQGKIGRDAYITIYCDQLLWAAPKIFDFYSNNTYFKKFLSLEHTLQPDLLGECRVEGSVPLPIHIPAVRSPDIKVLYQQILLLVYKSYGTNLAPVAWCQTGPREPGQNARVDDRKQLEKYL